eukprot:COSAG01_NODE_20539_length_948_cov_2.195524_1_plen_114_part_10
MAVLPTEAALTKFMEEWLTGLIGPLSAEGADRPDRRRYWAKVLSNQKKEWRKRIGVMLEQPEAEWQPLYFHMFEDIVRCAACLSAITPTSASPVCGRPILQRLIYGLNKLDLIR